MAMRSPTNYRRYFGPGEGHRVNRADSGTHEFNVSTEAPQRPRFWRTDEFQWRNAKRASKELPVKVLLTLGPTTKVSDGRVWDRYRMNPSTGQRRFTETRFRPMETAVGREFYRGVNIPDTAVILVTKSEIRGIDYEYEVILPTDDRHGDLRPPRGQSEAY